MTRGIPMYAASRTSLSPIWVGTRNRATLVTP